MPYFPPAAASGAPVDATYITQTLNGTLTAEAALTAGTNITLTPGAGILTIDAAAGGSSLPVVDETAIVYKTGNVAITQTHDINAYTVARLVTWPNAALTVAGLEVANVFTAAQTMPQALLTNTTALSLSSTLHALQTGLSSSTNIAISTTAIQARSNGAAVDLNLNPSGGAAAAGRVYIFGTSLATLSSTLHGFQIGLSNGANHVMSANRIQARNNGAAATLDLNPLGGTVNINQNSTAAFLVEQDGVRDNTLIVDTTNGRVGAGIVPSEAGALMIPAGSTTAPGLVFPSSDGAGHTGIYSITNVDTIVIQHYNSTVQTQFGYGSINLIGTSGAFKINGRIAVQEETTTAMSLGAGYTTVNSQAVLSVTRSVAAATLMTDLLVLTRLSSSGTPGNGMGGQVRMTIASSGSPTFMYDVGFLRWLWNDATEATRKPDAVLVLKDWNAEREIWRGRANGTAPLIGFLGSTPIARPTTYTLASTATRTMPTPEAAFTGQDNAQAGAVYAKSADLNTLQTRLDSVEGVLRQLIIDLASTSGYGLLAAS